MVEKIRNTCFALALLVLAAFFSFSAVAFPNDQSASGFLAYSAMVTSVIALVTAIIWINIEGSAYDSTLKRSIEEKINRMVMAAKKYRDESTAFIRFIEAVSFIVLIIGLLLTHAVILAVFVTLAGMLHSYISHRKLKIASENSLL